MRTHTYLSCPCVPVLATFGIICFSIGSRAAEVACPSNLFPSPTGSYQNPSADMVAYGTTVQLALDHCNKADRSVPPPTGTTPVTVVCGETAHFRVMSGGSTTPVWV